MKQKLCSMKEKKAKERSRSTRRMDELWKKKRGKVKEEGERKKEGFSKKPRERRDHRWRGEGKR